MRATPSSRSSPSVSANAARRNASSARSAASTSTAAAFSAGKLFVARRCTKCLNWKTGSCARKDSPSSSRSRSTPNSRATKRDRCGAAAIRSSDSAFVPFNPAPRVLMYSSSEAPSAGSAPRTSA